MDKLKNSRELYVKAHAKGGRPPKVKMFERLCIFLAYEYFLAVSTVFDIIQLVEKTVIKSDKFVLAPKKSNRCNRM